MKTFIITYIIINILSIGIKIGDGFKETTISSDARIFAFFVEIIFIIWAFNTL